MMIIDAFIAMLMLGTRINIAKYCSRIISAMSFVKLNFLADAICAAFVLLLSALSVINLPIELYFADRETMVKGLFAGALQTLAEIACVQGLNSGPTGPVSAIISFGVVIVSLLSWVLFGQALSFVQIIGIVVALVGVLAVTLSRPPQARQKMLSKRAAAQMTELVLE